MQQADLSVKPPASHNDNNIFVCTTCNKIRILDTILKERRIGVQADLKRRGLNGQIKGTYGLKGRKLHGPIHVQYIEYK